MVENVVNAPQQPTIKPNRKTSLMLLCSPMAMMIPSNKHPAAFETNVGKVKAVEDMFTFIA